MDAYAKRISDGEKSEGIAAALATHLQSSSTYRRQKRKPRRRKHERRYHQAFAQCLCDVDQLTAERKGSCFAAYRGKISLDFSSTPRNLHPSRCLCQLDMVSKTLWPCFPCKFWTYILIFLLQKKISHYTTTTHTGIAILSTMTEVELWIHTGQAQTMVRICSFDNITLLNNIITGLRVLLYANVSEYLPTSEAVGFRITVHDRHMVPFPDAFGYSAPTGFMSSFGVRMKQFIRLEPPYGHCQPGGEDNPNFIYKGFNYSVEVG
uniref:COesterase domain-containing protein n=1 Tax=Heterorhabditis bacteriophora TaxID=37862 RepID=A0A1I7WY49_HETBA